MGSTRWRSPNPLALTPPATAPSTPAQQVKALESLMQQRDRFDYVLIETTGLANPGPVAAALWTDEQLESR